jgi:large repetitive protein
MRAQRPQRAASNPRGRRFGASMVRVLSVTAVAATACAMMAGAASAATKHATATSVSVSPKIALTGAVVRLSATVKGSGRVPTGKVTFTWDGAKLCAARLHHGKAACNTRFFRARSYKVRGTYSGNATHKASWSTARVTVVNPPPPSKHATTTTITNANPGTVDAGDPYLVFVTVTSAVGTPSGTVVVAPTKPTGLPSSYSCTVTLVDGAGSCNVTPGAGSFGDIYYEATYSGDSTHAGSTSTGTHELIVPETTTTSVTPATATHGSVTLTATVIGQDKGNISPSAGGTGTVTFTVTQGSTTEGTCSKAPLTYNNAGANLATCTLTLAAGSYSVEAVYSGDPNNLTSTGTETLVVS